MAARVEVLLSTYNGVRYLAPLLESVWAQRYPDLTLSVRDDGSTDGTVELVRGLMGDRKGCRLDKGANVGAAKSFMQLLAHVDPGAEYAAFCDQDDIWLPEKLEVAVAKLSQLSGPALYCCAVYLTTDSGIALKVHARCVRGPSFANALVENIATGCTIVLNRAAIDLLCLHAPSSYLMHDAWCYLVVAGCGRVVYDKEPHVRYRLHSNNFVGVRTTAWSDWSTRALRQFASGKERALSRQAEQLKDLYWTSLTPDAAQELDAFLLYQKSLSSRLLYGIRGQAHRQRSIDDVIFRCLYVLRRV